MAEPTFSLQIEFVAGSWTNISSKDVLRASWERSVADMFRPLDTDQALFQLDNIDGAYSPKKNANMVPGKRIKFSATYSGSSYGLYSGRIREIKQTPGFGNQTALIEAMNEVDRIKRTQLTTPLFTNINAGSLFTEIMTRCAVASFSCEALSDTIPFAWYKDRPADDALFELVQSGNYKLYMDGNGTVQMKGRYFGAFDDSVASLDSWLELQYALSPDSVVNEVKINGQPRMAATSIATLGHIPGPITIPASSSIGLWLAYIDPLEPSQVTPAQSVVTPVSSTDLYFAANSDGTGTNLTSGVSLSFTAFGSTAVATLTNGNGSPGWVTRFQVRGYPVLRAGQIGIRVDDSSSQAVYGRQALELANLLVQDYSYLRNLASYIKDERKNPRDDVTYARKNEWPEQLSVEPADVVSMVESSTGVNSQWSIRSIDHEVALASGVEHVSTYRVEVFSDRPWLVLDHPSFGLLDSGRVLGL